MAKDKAGDSIQQANKTAFKKLNSQPTKFKDSIGGSDTDDFLKIKVKNTSSLDFQLKGLKANADLELLEKNGDLIKRSKKKGNKSEDLGATVGKGVYYLRVLSTDGKTKYKLSGTSNRETAGDSANDAQSITLSQAGNSFSDYVSKKADKRDYYTFDLDETSTVELSLAGIKGSVSLSLRDADDDVITSINSDGKTAGPIEEALDAGTYLVRVATKGKTKTRYELSASATPGGGGDFTDTVGNDFGSAAQLEDGVTDESLGTGDIDIYEFSTPAGASSLLTLKLSNLSSNAKLELLDSDQNVIQVSDQAGTANELIEQALAPNKNFFVRVTKSSSSAANTPYKLTKTLTAVPDLVGDDFGSATLIALPDFDTGLQSIATEILDINDIDVYKFTAPALPTDLTLKLTGLQADADFEVYLQGNPLAIASSSNTGIADEEVSVSLTANQTYFIKISPFSSNSAPFTPTSFTLQAEAEVGIADLAGNTPAEARDINQDPDWKFGDPAAKQGPINPNNYRDFVGPFDTNDYYRFDLDETSFLDLQVDFTQGNANVRLLDADGTTVIESVVGATGSPAQIQGVFKEGTYFLRVSPQANSSFVDYKLNLEAESTALQPAFIKDILNGPQSSAVAGDMVEIGGLLYFAADDGNGVGLWNTDGTLAGTNRLALFEQGTIDNLTVARIDGVDTIFFTAQTAATGIELWKYDGGTASLVKDILPGAIGSNIGATAGIVAVGDKIYFDAIGTLDDQGDVATDIELWVSDGTTAGTRVLELSPNQPPIFIPSFPSELTNVNGTLYFTATASFAPTKLYTIDAGTGNPIEVAGQDTLSEFANLINVDGTLYFTATDATRGQEIWRLDATGEPEALSDIVSGAAGAATISDLTLVGNDLYFVANNQTNDGIANNDFGLELWKMEIDPGTGTTTVSLAADINTTDNNIGSNPLQLTAVNDILYLVANDGINGRGLYEYNTGTDALSLVEYIDGGITKTVSSGDGITVIESAGEANLIAVGDFLYFRANTTAAGSELWRINPFNGLTEQLDLLTGASGSSPGDLTEVNGRLFFRATDGGATSESVGEELWVVGLPDA